jgi:hypothetical protein
LASSHGKAEATIAPMPMKKLCVAKPSVHRDVDAGVHDPQHAGRHPQPGRVGHHEQRQRGQDRAAEEIGPPPAEAVPGAIAQVADDRLHDQAGQRRGHPQDRQVLDLGAQGLEDAADVGVLQGEAELDAEEAEAHVPDLPETECRFALQVTAHGQSSARKRTAAPPPGARRNERTSPFRAGRSSIASA